MWLSSTERKMINYVPKDYWLEQGKQYFKQFKYNKKFKIQEEMIIDYLKSIYPFSTVLEVGCGFGRITKLILSNFPEILEYVAVDISPDQIENAKKYIKPIIGNNKLNLKFIISDIQSLKVDKKYDLVIASEVLLHILPDEIGQVICNLVGFSKRHIINIDAYGVHKELAPHNFLHQYEKLYQSSPSIAMVKRIPIIKKGLFLKVDVKQSMFHAQVLED